MITTHESQHQVAAEFPWLNLGPVRVTPVDLACALENLSRAVESGGPHFVCFCEANLLSNTLQDRKTAAVLEQASSIYADGIALLALARLCGHRLPSRIPGPTFILEACRHGVPLGWRHFFLGGEPGVADRLSAVLKARYAGLQVAGTASPPFRPLSGAEETDLRHQIEASGADLLWVCLGSPKQEKWMAAHLGQIQVPVMLGVGAAFDFHTATRPWAPAPIRRLGLEWIFRMFTGGPKTFLRNLNCVTTVAAYLGYVALRRSMEILRGRFTGRPAQLSDRPTVAPTTVHRPPTKP